MHLSSDNRFRDNRVCWELFSSAQAEGYKHKCGRRRKLERTFLFAPTNLEKIFTTPSSCNEKLMRKKNIFGVETQDLSFSASPLHPFLMCLFEVFFCFRRRKWGKTEKNRQTLQPDTEGLFATLNLIQFWTHCGAKSGILQCWITNRSRREKKNLESQNSARFIYFFIKVKWKTRRFSIFLLYASRL